MPVWLAVGIGGFLGAIARYQICESLSQWCEQRFGRPYPLGTFAVNVLGCLLIGLLITVVLEKRLSENTQKLLITGGLGSLTTFSTFGLDAVNLFREGKAVLAMGYVAANLVIGLLAVLAGLGIARLFIR